MADRLPTVVTRAEAIIEFEENVLPRVIEIYEQDGIPDIPARSEAWNDWTDSMCKTRWISDWQYANWSCPRSCER